MDPSRTFSLLGARNARHANTNPIHSFANIQKSVVFAESVATFLYEARLLQMFKMQGTATKAINCTIQESLQVELFNKGLKVCFLLERVANFPFTHHIHKDAATSLFFWHAV